VSHYIVSTYTDAAIYLSTKHTVAMAESKALVKFDVHRSTNELVSTTDVVIRDATTGDPVVWEPITCEAPEWFYRTVRDVDRGLERFKELIQNCQANNQEIRSVFPVLSEQYERLVKDQEDLYLLVQRDRERLHEVQQESFWELRIASNQFADQVATAMMAAKATDTAQFEFLSAATEQLAKGSQHIMDVMDTFAKEKDEEIKTLQETGQKTKKELALLRKKVNKSQKDAADQEARLQQFFDAAIQRAKESANPIQLVSELEGLARSVKEGKSVRDSPEPPKAPREPDGGEGSSHPPTKPFDAKDWELYNPDKDAAEGVGGAGGGGGKGTRGAAGAGSPPGSPSDTSSDEGSPPPRRTPSGRVPSSPLRRTRKRSPSPKRAPRDPVRVTIEKPVLDKPEKFSGRDTKPTFAAWWARVGNYFKYYETTYVKETDKIAFVGHRMSGNAEEWYEARAAQLKRQNKEDDWKAFSSAIETRFSSRFEQRDALRKIDRIVYEGDIELYIDKMEIANTRAGLSGVIWREKLKGGLTKPMKKKLSNVGRLPEDDIEFVEVLREVGKNLEDEVKEEARSQRKSPEPKNPKKHSRSHEVKDHNASHRVNKKTSKKYEKGDKGDKGSSAKKDQRYKTKEDATKGVDPKLVEKRFKNNDCLACGKPNHRWFQCRGPIVTTSSRTVAGTKRRIPDSAIAEEEEEKPQRSTKKAKVSARGVKKEESPEPRGYVKRIPAWEKKLFEEDSEKESD
jgi:hypothetical protein